MLPSAFPDGVGLYGFFTGLNHTARVLVVYASSSGRPSDARLTSSCTFGLGWAGFVPAGFHFEVSAHGILLNQTWLAHQEVGKFPQGVYEFARCAAIASFGASNRTAYRATPKILPDLPLFLCNF
jgi:hypothetical protein